MLYRDSARRKGISALTVPLNIPPEKYRTTLVCSMLYRDSARRKGISALTVHLGLLELREMFQRKLAFAGPLKIMYPFQSWHVPTNFGQHHHLLALDQNEISHLWKGYSLYNHKALTSLALVPKLYLRKYHCSN